MQADGVFPAIDVKVCEPLAQSASFIKRYVDSRRRKLSSFLL